MILTPSSRLAAAGLPRLAAAATATAASGSSVLTASSRRNFTTAKADSVQIAAVVSSRSPNSRLEDLCGNTWGSPEVGNAGRRRKAVTKEKKWLC